MLEGMRCIWEDGVRGYGRLNGSEKIVGHEAVKDHTT